MEPIDERMQVIKNYELGLSDFMARSGVGFFSISVFAKRSG